jgi:hypothetical protein
MVSVVTRRLQISGVWPCNRTDDDEGFFFLP